jgi:ribonuclease BN (tRNA processing enzyme)
VALRLTVLGCSGSYPGPGGAASGYLVQSERTTLWLDAGSGTLANLQRHVGLDDVDAVVLSHEHADHWTDIEGFYVACTYGEQPRWGIPVLAPAGLSGLTIGAGPPTFSWRTISDGTHTEIGDITLTFSRTDHHVETLAVRVESGGKVLGYSADSGPGWSMESLGPGIDLALCEASFLQDRVGSVQHFSARQAGTTARAAGAGRLVLTHTWPTIDLEAIRAEGELAFGGPVDIAAIDAVYEVGA